MGPDKALKRSVGKGSASKDVKAMTGNKMPVSLLTDISNLMRYHLPPRRRVHEKRLTLVFHFISVPLKIPPPFFLYFTDGRIMKQSGI